MQASEAVIIVRLESMFSIFLGILFVISGSIELFGPGWQVLGLQSLIANIDPATRWSAAVSATILGLALIGNAWRIYLDDEVNSWAVSSSRFDASETSNLSASFRVLSFLSGGFLIAAGYQELLGQGWSVLFPEQFLGQTHRIASALFASMLIFLGIIFVLTAWRVSFEYSEKDGHADRALLHSEVAIRSQGGVLGLIRFSLGLCFIELGFLDLVGPGWPELLSKIHSGNFYQATSILFALVLVLAGLRLILLSWTGRVQRSPKSRLNTYECLERRTAYYGGYLSVALRFTFGLLFIELGCLELYKPGWKTLLPDFISTFFQQSFHVEKAVSFGLVTVGLALLGNALRLMASIPKSGIERADWETSLDKIEGTSRYIESTVKRSLEQSGRIKENFATFKNAGTSRYENKFRSNDNKLSNHQAYSLKVESIKESDPRSRNAPALDFPFLMSTLKDLLWGILFLISSWVSLIAKFMAKYIIQFFGQRHQSPKETEKASSSEAIQGGAELSSTFARCRGALVAIGIFSAFSNILTLTGSFYMLEVYDRVVPSRSVPTLIVLSIVALMLMAIQGGLDFIRSRVLIRASNFFEDRLGMRVFDITTRVATTLTRRGNGLQPIRDLDSIKAFLSSGGPGALMDLPWLPFYMAIIFMFHWVLGVTALVGAVILVSLTFITEMMSHKPIKFTNERIAERSELALAGRRNAEVLASLGMKERLAERYRKAGIKLAEFQTRASDVSGGLGSISKTLRMVLQAAMLGIGALLVIAGEASSGIIIAGSILSGRALAPVDQAIANWKLFVAARQGWRRLSDAFAKLPAEPERMSLPPPKTNLKVENLLVLEPGGQKPILRDINFELKAGQSLCILGPSGSGKSTLARTLVKAWIPSAGRVRIDGAALDQWPSEQLGAYLGYLPQDVELFSGTISDNIARLSEKIEAEAVIAAAQAAGAHQLILTLKDGYQTEIGEAGAVLSAGQRQRIALARALYNNPFVVVLDEPNSNLDADGDKALLGAIDGVKKRNGIIIVISHRPSVLQAFDLVMIMNEGRSAAFGPRDEVLAKFTGGARPPPAGPAPNQAVAPAAMVIQAPKPQLVKAATLNTMKEEK